MRRTEILRRALAPVLALLAVNAVGAPARAEPATESATEIASGCHDIRYRDIPYTVCAAHFDHDDLRLWYSGGDGLPLGTFDRLRKTLRVGGERLEFAMNAGMYRPGLAPAGLLIVAGKEIAPIVTAAGPGNFGLLPNGVFCVGPKGYSVIESRAFAAHPPVCRYATQSGPMLVIAGKLHPKFIASSTSRHIRNGVGVSRDGKTAYVVISDRAVTFTEFATLFRDRLKTPNALYLDGKISRLDAPAIGREDLGFPIGPM
ncbi:hypothetical protein FGG78_36680, partial [Thioclava sp. BHET1]